MGATITEAQTILNLRFPTTGATDHIAYSVSAAGNPGAATEWANLARTPIGATGWAGATGADPSVKQNANQLTSAAVVTAGGTVNYFAIFSAITVGTQRTDWQTVNVARTLSVGDAVVWAAGDCKITLT